MPWRPKWAKFSDGIARGQQHPSLPLVNTPSSASPQTFLLCILAGLLRVYTPASIEALADPYSLRAINLLQEVAVRLEARTQ